MTLFLLLDKFPFRGFWGHPGDVHDLGGKAFNCSGMNKVFIVVFWCVVFIALPHISPILNLLWIFIIKYQFLIKFSFVCVCWYNHMIFVFPFVSGMLYLLNHIILNLPWIPRINPTRSWWMIILMCYWN